MLRRIIGPFVIGASSIVVHWALTLLGGIYRRRATEIWALAAFGPITGYLGFRRRRDLASVLGLIGGLAAYVLVWWYFRVYATYGERRDRNEVGSRFAEFDLPTSDGNRLSLDDLAGGRCLVLCYRGGWCPFCIRELTDLRNSYQEFLDRGVRVVAVSVDSPEQEEMLKKRIGLDITFVSDQHGELLDALDISDDEGLVRGLDRAGFGSEELDRAIYMPTTFLLDEDGVIRWLHRTETYRVRLKPEHVIAAVDEVFGGPAEADAVSAAAAEA